jgi:hypothetical protein
MIRMSASTTSHALAARLGPDRLRLAGELLRFGVVGTVGFAVDA